MRKVLTVSLLSVALAGCVVARHHPHPAPPPPPVVHQPAPPVAKSVVVRLCKGQIPKSASVAAGRHNLTILKQSSPVIYELGWRDPRSVDAVIDSLRPGRVFCFVQVNNRFRAL